MHHSPPRTPPRTVFCTSRARGDCACQLLRADHAWPSFPTSTMCTVSKFKTLHHGPQNFTFYELIATKARGKSGPLFNFDVHGGSLSRVVACVP